MAATVVDVGDIRQKSVFLSNDKRPVISGTTGIRKKRSQSSNHRQKTHGLERDTRAPRTQTLCSWSLDPRRTPDPVMNPLPEKPGEKGMDPCRAWTTISRMYGCIKKQYDGQTSSGEYGLIDAEDSRLALSTSTYLRQRLVCTVETCVFLSRFRRDRAWTILPCPRGPERWGELEGKGRRGPTTRNVSFFCGRASLN